MTSKYNQQLIGGNLGHTKASVAQLPETAWDIISGGEQKTRLQSVVSWMFACQNLRGTTAQNVPWQLSRGETVLVNSDDKSHASLQWWLDAYPALIFKTVTSTLTYGKAYWLLQNGDAPKWLAPSTIKPQYNKSTGELTHFVRSANGKQTDLQIEEVVYFWLPDPDVENGVPITYPGRAAHAGAMALMSMDEFISSFFKGGMLKQTILTFVASASGGITTTITPDEQQAVKEWWQRVGAGIKNAWSTKVLNGNFEPKVVGGGVDDLGNTTLTQDERRSIEVAYGLPETKLNQAANLATKQADDVGFITETVLPHLDWVASVINAQVLSQIGIALSYNANQMDVMQVDETQRAQSFAIYAQYMPVETVVAMLGIDIPEGFELTQEQETAVSEPEPAQTQSPIITEAEEQLKRWSSNAKNIDPYEFHSDVLSPARIEEIFNSVKYNSHPVDELQRDFAAVLKDIQDNIATD